MLGEAEGARCAVERDGRFAGRLLVGAGDALGLAPGLAGCEAANSSNLICSSLSPCSRAQGPRDRQHHAFRSADKGRCHRADIDPLLEQSGTFVGIDTAGEKVDLLCLAAKNVQDRKPAEIGVFRSSSSSRNMIELIWRLA